MEQTQPESMQTLVVCELDHTGSNVLCVGEGEEGEEEEEERHCHSQVTPARSPVSGTSVGPQLLN